MRQRWLFRVACCVVAVLSVSSGVVAVLDVHPGVDVAWQWRILREPFTSGLLAALAVGLLYWKCGAPGSTIWSTAYEAGVRDGTARGAAAAAPNVVPIQERRSSSS